MSPESTPTGCQATRGTTGKRKGGRRVSGEEPPTPVTKRKGGKKLYPGCFLLRILMGHNGERRKQMKGGKEGNTK